MSFAVYASFISGAFSADPTEDYWRLGPKQIYTDYAGTPKLIHCHERSSSAKATATIPELATLVTEIGRNFVVLVPDTGPLSLWGNDASTLTYMEEAYDYITGGSGEKIFLSGVSHGGLTALNWAKTYPEKVAGIALIQPALGLADLKVVEGGVLAAEIDVAYGVYSDATDGPIYSPNVYGDALDPEIPVCIWTSNAGYDTVCRTGPENEFLELRPTTMRKSVGNIQHGLPPVTIATPGVVQFLRSHRL